MANLPVVCVVSESDKSFISRMKAGTKSLYWFCFIAMSAWVVHTMTLVMKAFKHEEKLTRPPPHPFSLFLPFLLIFSIPDKRKPSWHGNRWHLCTQSRSALHTVESRLHRKQFPQHTEHFSLGTLQSILYSAHFPLHTLTAECTQYCATALCHLHPKYSTAYPWRVL